MSHLSERELQPGQVIAHRHRLEAPIGRGAIPTPTPREPRQRVRMTLTPCAPSRPARAAFTRLSAVLIGVALALAAPVARAQVRTEDRVAAESLFTEGRQLLLAGDYVRACAKLEASRDIEPALGTTLNLADCYEKLGRIASAWAEFRSAAAAAQKADDPVRKEAALERAELLEPRLSRLRVQLADPSVHVLQNGEPLSASVVGSAIPVDPGLYRFDASAPGKAPWSQTFDVQGEGVTVEVEIPELDPAHVAPPASREQPVTFGLSPMAAPPSRGARTLAWVLGGVGAASVATGAVFTALAASSWSRAEDSCVDYPYQCSQAGLDHADDAETQAAVATVGFIVGGAALGASVVLFLTSDGEPEGPALELGLGRVSLRGGF